MKRVKKAASMMLALALMLSMFTVSAFADIDYTQWNTPNTYPDDVRNTKYFNAVKSLMDKKIITGDTDGLFHPEKSITRAEFCTIIAKSTNIASGKSFDELKVTFGDLDGYGWASSYIGACADKGWVKGVAENVFAPGKEITYAEAMTVLIRVRTGNELYGQWPDVYIAYAERYNMTGAEKIADWNAPASKGHIAMFVDSIIAPKGGGNTSNNGTQNTEVSAYLENISIEGSVAGQTINAATVVISLENTVFSSNVEAGNDVTSWFDGMDSHGMKATVDSFSSSMQGQIRIKVEQGTNPVVQYEEKIKVKIPQNAVNALKEITVTQNANAVYSIK